MRLGSVNTDNSARTVAVNGTGTRAYVATTVSLAAYDVSGNGAPVLLGSPYTFNQVYQSFVSQVAVNEASTRAYLGFRNSNGANGLQAYDVSAGSTPVLLGSLVSPGGTVLDIALNAAGTRAYVTTSNNMLATYDLSGGVPVLLGSPVATDSNPQRLVLNGAGTRAYVLNQTGNSLQVFSLGAALPTVVGIGSDGSLGTLTLPQLADNLGNHTATQNLNLAGYQLVSGGSTGLALTNAGNVGIGTTGPTSTFQVNGSVAASIRTSNIITENDYTVIVTGNVSLPAPSTANVGRMYYLLNGNSNTITGTLRDPGTSSSTNSFTLTANIGSKGITVQSDGTQWWIIGRE